MNLQAAIDSYLSLRRSLGAVFLAETRILQSFGRAIGDIPIDTIDISACRAFCRGTGPPTRWWERKHYTLRDFFASLVSRGDLAAVPLPETGPKLPRCFEPYVYSRDEIQRLLDATSLLEDERSPLQHITFRTLLLVLSAAGLRPSEGLHLRCCDVDLDERLLAIWDTKFFKSRLVPVGTDLAMTLESYRKERLRLPIAGRHALRLLRDTGRQGHLAGQAGEGVCSSARPRQHRAPLRGPPATSAARPASRFRCPSAHRLVPRGR